VRLSDEAFLAHLGGRLPATAGAEALGEVQAADLYLACACAAGEPHALAAFEARFMRGLDPALARLRLPTAQVEEVKQVLRERLLVGRATPDGAEGSLAGYTGRGPLSGWLRVTAVRAALKLLKRARREEPAEDELISALPSGEEDPELQHLKGLYRREFKEAFEAAVRSLSSRERNLLRHHYADELNIDEIGLLYHVHRATVARWLSKARQHILAATRKLLIQKLNVPRAEYESIMRLIQSQLQVSLGSALRSQVE